MASLRPAYRRPLIPGRHPAVGAPPVPPVGCHERPTLGPAGPGDSHQIRVLETGSNENIHSAGGRPTWPPVVWQPEPAHVWGTSTYNTTDWGEGETSSRAQISATTELISTFKRRAIDLKKKKKETIVVDIRVTDVAIGQVKVSMFGDLPYVLPGFVAHYNSFILSQVKKKSTWILSGTLLIASISLREHFSGQGNPRSQGQKGPQ